MHGMEQESPSAKTLSGSIGQHTDPIGSTVPNQCNDIQGYNETSSSAAKPHETGFVDSPTVMEPPTGGSSVDGTHLSGHEARAFPGMFSGGSRSGSGSLRKDDGT